MNMICKENERIINLVKKDGMNLKLFGESNYIKDENIQTEAVKQNGLSIFYIKNPSERIQIEAVNQNIYSIQYIEKPFVSVELIVINQNPKLIQYIENPSVESQYISLSNDINNKKLINNFDENILLNFRT